MQLLFGTYGWELVFFHFFFLRSLVGSHRPCLRSLIAASCGHVQVVCILLEKLRHDNFANSSELNVQVYSLSDYKIGTLSLSLYIFFHFASPYRLSIC